MNFTRSTRVSIAALAAVGLFALAGCSNTSADDTADEQPAGDTTAEQPADGAEDTGADEAASEWPDTLTFAQIPSESASSIAEQNAVLIAALEGELGIKVELQEATSYAAVIEALRAGQVDIGSMGPFSYVVAKDGGAGVEPLGALADSADEAASYQSYAIVPAGSDITDLAGFAGKNVCFVDQTSTSGYLFPSAGLLEAGVDPTTDLTPVFAGGHDASALSVADGTCDAGFAFDAIVDTELIESGQMEEGAVEVIWKSEDIPNSPNVVSTKLPQDLQDELRRIYLEVLNKPALVEAGYCDSEDECELPESSAYGFIEVEDSLYDGIRAVCDITQSESCVA